MELQGTNKHVFVPGLYFGDKRLAPGHKRKSIPMHLHSGM